MNELNRILAEREGWTCIKEYQDGVIGGRLKGVTIWSEIPYYESDDDLDRAIRGLDNLLYCDFIYALNEVMGIEDQDEHYFLFRATPQQKRAALANVFGVEEGW